MYKKKSLPKIVTLVAAVAMGVSSTCAQDDDDDPIRELVSRLDLESYKAVIKGLAQFGDRRQGTERNRRAVDWIEEQLQAAGCTNIERIHYVLDPEPRPPRQRRSQSDEIVDLTTSSGG